MERGISSNKLKDLVSRPKRRRHTWAGKGSATPAIYHGEKERARGGMPSPPTTHMLHERRRNDSLMRPMTAAIVLRQECRRTPDAAIASPLFLPLLSRRPTEKGNNNNIALLPSLSSALSSVEMEA